MQQLILYSSTSRRVDYLSVARCRSYQLWAARLEKGFRRRRASHSD